MLGEITGTEFKNLFADFLQKKFELCPENTEFMHSSNLKIPFKNIYDIIFRI